MVAAAAGGFLNRMLPVRGDLKEHGAFKRLKLALLSIGVRPVCMRIPCATAYAVAEISCCARQTAAMLWQLWAGSCTRAEPSAWC